jgi:hypothetical protein
MACLALKGRAAHPILHPAPGGTGFQPVPGDPSGVRSLIAALGHGRFGTGRMPVLHGWHIESQFAIE